MPPLLIDIPQMIDLALGTPEIGVVNFSVLHNLLHAIVEILNLDKYRIEFRGHNGIKIEKLIQHIPIQPIITIQEFKVDVTNGKEQKVDKRTPVPKQKDDRYDKILVIRKTDELEGDALSATTRGRPPVQQPVQIVSQDDFRKLAPEGGIIHDPIGRYLPKNQDVFDSARGESEDSRNPVGEMWYILNVAKRLDATEVAIEKITSMIRDISEEYHKMKNSMERFGAMADVSHLADKIDLLEKNFHDNFGKQKSARHTEPKSTPAAGGGGGAGSARQQGSAAQATGGQVSTAAPPKQAAGVTPPAKQTQAQSTQSPAAAGHSSGSIQHTPDRRSGAGFESSGSERPLHRDSDNSEPFAAFRPSNVEDVLEEYNDLKAEVERLKAIVESIVSPKTMSDIQAGGQGGPTLTGPPQLIPGKGAKGTGDMRDFSRRMELLESKLNTVEHQIFDVEKDLAELTDRFEDDGRPGTAIKADFTGIADVYAKVTAMKADLDSTIDRCNFLIVERDQIVENIDNMTKRMEEFKSVKVDRDEIDELLAEKADYNMLQRKVSVDQFDATKRHLTNGLVEALDRLTEQGKNWEQAVDEVRTMTLSKVGREELTPLREYIDLKVNAVQERLKALAALRRDPEAAGTRSKYLRGVNCISCDQDVIMRLDEPSGVPRSEAIPPPSTLKPFLVYELDSIRKQRMDPQSRNLHHFELMTRAKSKVTVDGRPKTLANRYCGGSHTVLTPQDRVQRCKFNKKLMPADCFVKTDEGCYYKAIKKACTCPDQKVQMLSVPEDKTTTSARSSKSALKPTDETVQTDTIEVVKQVTSVRSSRSDIRVDQSKRASTLTPKSSKELQQAAADALSGRGSGSVKAEVVDAKVSVDASVELPLPKDVAELVDFDPGEQTDKIPGGQPNEPVVQDDFLGEVLNQEDATDNIEIESEAQDVLTAPAVFEEDQIIEVVEEPEKDVELNIDEILE